MKSQFAIATVLALISASPAFASETTGTITAINTKTDTIALSDGKSYVLPERIEAEQFKVGQKLRVTYSGKSGKWLASKVDVVRWEGCPTRMKAKTVLISGAGIGGPTLAFWLKAGGFEPTLVEHAPALRAGALSSTFGTRLRPR